MRIGVVSEHASPLARLGGVDAGGQNLHVAELSRALARRGHDVRVYTRRDSPDLPDQVRWQQDVIVEHVPAGPPEPLRKDALLPYMGDFGAWLAHRWSDGWGPDVVHAHFWMSGLAALTAVHDTGIPVVQTYHALGVVKRRFQGAKDTSPDNRIDLERTLGHLVERLVAQCSDEVFELAKMGVPRTRIALVPSGVDVDHFHRLGPAVPRNGRPRILTVGRLVERKGFADLIRALVAVPDAELVIVGGPPARELSTDPEAVRLRTAAERAGVAERVALVGGVPRDEMPMWYRSADVVACAPWYEPFGLTPLEAMACGVPVVATAVGGLTDTVIDGVTGIHVPPREPRALAAAIQELLGNQVLRLSYSVAGPDRVHARYTWGRSAGDLVRVYREAIGASCGSRKEAAPR